MRRYLVRAAAIGALFAGFLVAVVLVLDARHGTHAAATTATTTTTTKRPKPRPPQRPKGPHNAPVPILMYHVLAEPPANAPFPELYVRPSDFAAEMNWLAQQGYHAVTLRRLYDFWRGRRVLPKKPIVLTFDDGYHSDFTVALPVLRQHHWAGVLNLLVENLKPVWGTRPGMVEKLIAAGWEVDAHTLTHRDLTSLAPDQLTQEVAGSREEIKRRFRVPVDFFCYPSGRYDDAVIAAVRAAGFLGATTEHEGFATPSDMFTLDRIRVEATDGVGGLERKLSVASAA
ncbi:MAG TPA: polysaccharide deacetylase family protein [Gaiellaceae bacterium]